MENGIPNVLAERYASDAMRRIWSPRGRVILEREFWIAVLRAQKDLGLGIEPGAIEAYEAVREKVDLGAIAARERRTRHDVKARIEEFCELAGHEEIHKGMTSRDLTENVEQLQVRRSLALVLDKTGTALLRLSGRIREFSGLLLTARTHNVPAQPTTFGKRLAMFASELALARQGLRTLHETYPVRGLKGAVGTQLDLLTLFGGDASKVSGLEQRLLHHLGFTRTLGAVGQVYPRSLDAEVLQALLRLAAGPANLARSLRLMAGHETASEGFAPGQTGSSAMPHKMNSRSCERINGFQVLLRGYAAMAGDLSGGQWHEGDVSCSVVRRVAQPDAFFALDGLLETFLTVLAQMEVHGHEIERENRRYLPFLATTTVLMEAVRKGVGRETAHAAIKEHAVATVRDLRGGRIETNDLAARLADDPRLGLARQEIDRIIENPPDLLGSAEAQALATADEIEANLADLPAEWRDYTPGAIL